MLFTFWKFPLKTMMPRVLRPQTPKALSASVTAGVKYVSRNLYSCDWLVVLWLLGRIFVSAPIPSSLILSDFWATDLTLLWVGYKISWLIPQLLILYLTPRTKVREYCLKLTPRWLLADKPSIEGLLLRDVLANKSLRAKIKNLLLNCLEPWCSKGFCFSQVDA